MSMANWIERLVIFQVEHVFITGKMIYHWKHGFRAVIEARRKSDDFRYGAMDLQIASSRRVDFCLGSLNEPCQGVARPDFMRQTKVHTERSQMFKIR